MESNQRMELNNEVRAYIVFENNIRIELSEVHAHIVSYAWGYYKRGVMIDDLKIIISKVNGIPLEMIGVFDVYDIITNLFDKINRIRPFNSFWRELKRFFQPSNGQISLNIENLIADMLGHIAITETEYVRFKCKLDFSLLGKNNS